MTASQLCRLGASGFIALAAPSARAHAQHPTITIHIGDTLGMRFSIRTDTVLRAQGGGSNNVIAARCGTSVQFFSDSLRGVALHRDTVNVIVTGCASAPDTVVASVTVITGDSVQVGAVQCVSVVARNKAGQILTGKHFVLQSSDTSVATIGGVMPSGATCPDTTINPANLPAAPPLLDVALPPQLADRIRARFVAVPIRRANMSAVLAQD